MENLCGVVESSWVCFEASVSHGEARVWCCVCWRNTWKYLLTSLSFLVAWRVCLSFFFFSSVFIYLFICVVDFRFSHKIVLASICSYICVLYYSIFVFFYLFQLGCRHSPFTSQAPRYSHFIFYFSINVKNHYSCSNSLSFIFIFLTILSLFHSF